MNFEIRLDEMEIAVNNPSFRETTGNANEVDYWVFDYDPAKELEVRARIKYMQEKNKQDNQDFNLVVFDLYDIVIDYLEKKNYMDKCFKFEKQKGFSHIVKAVSNSLKINEPDSVLVRYIQDHTPENAVIFLTGIGKCYPLLRSHKVLNNLFLTISKTPVVLFFPGSYNELELILFNEIKDDNYYRAHRLIK